jgi:uncharacterized protein (DUF433 family)
MQKLLSRRTAAVTLPDFLTEWPHGQIVLTGHRIGLYHVVKYYNEGYSPEMLLEQFPTLTRQQIEQVLDFYRDNRGEVDTYVARCRAEIERQAALPQQGPSADELKRRLASKGPAKSA